jgi:CO dehydrogenase maturation factor
MPFIALAGKGGSGKSTVAALIIRILKESGAKPILALDADPNFTLPYLLGVSLPATLADIVSLNKKIPADNIPGGMSRERYLEYQLQEALYEGAELDLLVMGRPEGPGCYCFINNLLKKYLENLSKNYTYIVMDNEAGMEHLSRRTARRIDTQFIVAEPTLMGIKTAQRIHQLTLEMEISVGKTGIIIVNRSPEILPPKLEEALKAAGLSLWGTIPYIEELPQLELEGKSIWDLPSSSPALKAMQTILDIRK